MWLIERILTLFSKEQTNYILYFSICIIGGTTWAAQKIGLVDSLPIWSACWRFLIAGAILFLILAIRKKIKIDIPTVKMAGIYGVFYFAIPFGVVYNVSWYLPSGLISIFGALVPLFALLFNYILKGAPAKGIQKLGICVAIIGVVVIFSNELSVSVNGQVVFYSIALLLAFGITAFTMVVLKRNINKIDRMSFNMLSLLIGGIALLGWSLVFEDGPRVFSGSNLLALLYLAVLGSSIAICINTHLMHQWHVTKMSSSLYLSPLIALYVGYAFLGEKLALVSYLGSALVLVGVYLINKKQNRMIGFKRGTVSNQNDD